MNCSNCNQPLDPGASFCGNCGQPVTLQAVPQPVPAAPAVTAQPVGAPLQPQPPVGAPSPQQSPAAPVQPVTPPQPGPSAPVAQPVQPAAQPVAPQVQAPVFMPSPGVAAGFPQPTVSAAGPLPAYAQPPAANGHAPGEVRAIIGLIIAILAIPGAIIPLVGFVLGLTGIILGTMSTGVKKLIAILSMVFGFIGIILAIAVYIFAVQSHNKNASVADSVKTNTAQTVSTACYNLKLPKNLHVTSDSSSCKMNAIDGQTEADSTVAYLVEGLSSSNTTSANFISIASQVAPKIADQASTDGQNISLSSQHQGTFAGKTAYLMDVTVSNGAKGQMALVYDEASNGDNVFIVLKVAQAGDSKLSDLESSFNWL